MLLNAEIKKVNSFVFQNYLGALYLGVLID